MADGPKLKRYRAYGRLSGLKYLGEFEAASTEGARELAFASEAARHPLCFRCRAGTPKPVEVRSLPDVAVQLVEPGDEA